MKLFRSIVALSVSAAGVLASTSAIAVTTSYISLTPDAYTFSVSDSGKYSFSVGALAKSFTMTLYSDYDTGTQTGDLLATAKGSLVQPGSFSAQLQTGINYTYTLVSKLPSFTLALTRIKGPGNLVAPISPLPAVPEPEEYALMLAGLAAVAAVVARRRKAGDAMAMTGLAGARA